ncbi:MAG: hypothetical protein P9M06_07590 [Candidatus Saelkia tenebricola]|nr:hypothetical protein [Candidatus Saelkia tenebricola]
MLSKINVKVLLIVGIAMSIMFYLPFSVRAAENGEEEFVDLIRLLYQKSKQVDSYKADFAETRINSRGVTKLEGKCVYKKDVGLKIEVNIPKEYGGVNLSILTIKNGIMVFYDKFQGVMEESNLDQLRLAIGEKHVVLFDPMENSVLTKPCIFQELIEFNPIAFKIESNDNKQYYVVDIHREHLPRVDEGVIASSQGITEFIGKIWIDADNGLLSAIKIYTNDQLIYAYDIKNIQINIEVLDNMFDCLAPENVKVVDTTLLDQKEFESIKDQILYPNFVGVYQEE